MKITIHISFFYIEDRLKYLNKIISETNNYKINTDIYIHTNTNNLNLYPYTNGSINIIYHDLSNIHPFYLTWKCRELIAKQIELYDIFMYIEDDILVPNNAIDYWLKYNEILIEKNYNLGFVRIEVENNIEYITDLYGENFDTIINIENDNYCVNNKNPYCAFWIYNKNEFKKFIESKYYILENIIGYGIREKSAIGLHGVDTKWYKNTIIPIIDNKLIESCKIYHLPNNYVTNKSSLFATIKFNDALTK